MSCLPFPQVKAAASVDLFCLPYAGGSSALFREWDALFPEWVSVRPVELPGRGTRMITPLVTDPAQLAQALSDELAGHIERPWAIFGHSLGAALGYRMVHLMSSDQPLLGFFPSGRHSPTCPDPARMRAHLNYDDLLQEVRDLNGSPPELLDNEELMALLLPIIRADFHLSERISVLPALGPLPCDMHVFGSTDDPEVPVAELQHWQDVAAAGFAQQLLPGDHFFLHHAAQREQMRDAICAVLSNALAAISAPRYQHL